MSRLLKFKGQLYTKVDTAPKFIKYNGLVYAKVDANDPSKDADKFIAKAKQLISKGEALLKKVESAAKGKFKPSTFRSLDNENDKVFDTLAKMGFPIDHSSGIGGLHSLYHGETDHLDSEDILECVHDYLFAAESELDECKDSIKDKKYVEKELASKKFKNI